MGRDIHEPVIPERTISVIVTACRRDVHYLKRCLPAIQWQEPTEIIVTEDGASIELDWQFSKIYRHDILYRGTRGENLATSRNRAVEKATSEWIKFIDADDILAPFALNSLRFANVQAGDRVISGGMAHVIDGIHRYDVVPDRIPPSDCVKPLPPWDFMDRVNPAVVSQCFIRRQTLLDVGGFDERIEFEEDWELWLRIREKFGLDAFANLPARICYYWISREERKKKEAEHAFNHEVIIDGESVDVRAYFAKRYGIKPL